MEDSEIKEFKKPSDIYVEEVTGIPRKSPTKDSIEERVNTGQQIFRPGTRAQVDALFDNVITIGETDKPVKRSHHRKRKRSPSPLSSSSTEEEERELRRTERKKKKQEEKEKTSKLVDLSNRMSDFILAMSASILEVLFIIKQGDSTGLFEDVVKTYGGRIEEKSKKFKEKNK